MYATHSGLHGTEKVVEGLTLVSSLFQCLLTQLIVDGTLYHLRNQYPHFPINENPVPSLSVIAEQTISL